jgi:hypothetical protein
LKDPENAVKADLERYCQLGGRMTYPFPVVDFAMRVFGLDVQYEDFCQVFSSGEYDLRELYGCLFPDGHFFCGMDKIILINTNRAPFRLGDTIIPEEFYIENAERQTIAHETGHYCGHYRYEKDEQMEMFKDRVVADAPVSILVYPPGEEVFANKYSRYLLMPETEVRRLIAERELHGTIDLRNQGRLFTEKFGVTQFMVEIRLNELQIYFVNGVYIRKANRFHGKPYSATDLLSLMDLARDYDMQPGYYDFDSIVSLYNEITGETRASAPLYFAFWRLMQGLYDDRFPEVFEKRVAELVRLEAAKKNKTDTKAV